MKVYVGPHSNCMVGMVGEEGLVGAVEDEVAGAFRC